MNQVTKLMNFECYELIDKNPVIENIKWIIPIANIKNNIIPSL